MVSKTSLKSPAASAVRCRISACSKLRARQCSSFECFRDERTASRENALTAMPLSNSPRTAAVNQARVLLIACDSRLASFLDRALAVAGYQVERAADGMPALALFEACTADIVLLDLDA